MLVIVGCEESQEIAKAFRAKGHEAYSCDLQECSGGHPEWHLKMDVHKAIKIIRPNLGIFHPPCNKLTNSVWWYIIKNNLYNEVRKAAEFFNSLLNADIEKIALENPVQNKFAKSLIRHQEQSIQPWQFGEDASKRTCLWLKNLPLLQPTNIISKKRYANQTPGGWNKLGPGANRSKMRSKTYTGIAQAMADQWG